MKRTIKSRIRHYVFWHPSVTHEGIGDDAATAWEDSLGIGNIPELYKIKWDFFYFANQLYVSAASNNRDLNNSYKVRVL